MQRAGGKEIANKNSCATWEVSAYCKGTAGVGPAIADNRFFKTMMFDSLTIQFAS